jgi:hypothetical protein
MNIKLRQIKTAVLGIVMVAALQATTAFAQPGTVVQNDVAVPVGTSTVTVDINYLGVSNVVSGDFIITYDAANLTPTNIPFPGGMFGECQDASWSTNWLCNISAPGTIIFTSNAVLTGLPTELIGSIEFDTSSAAIGSYPLPLSGENYFIGITETTPPVGSQDGLIQILDFGPAFVGDPAQGLIAFGPVPQGDPSPLFQDIVITNGGDGGTTLMSTSTCTLTANPRISLDTDGNFSVGDLPDSDTETVSCSTAAEGFSSATLTCPHNGTNGPDAVYTVECTIGPPPVPNYNSSPTAPGGVIPFGTIPEGNPVANQQLSIDNDTGQNLSVLTGQCSLVLGNTAISLVGGPTVPYSIVQGEPAAVMELACNTDTQSFNNDTLECTHNDPDLQPNPVQYFVECTVGEPDPAIYNSVPGEGTTPMTPPGGVAEDEVVPPLMLDIWNDAEPGDDDLVLQDCQITGGNGVGVITANPPILATTLPVGVHTMVEFSCDTTNFGDWEVQYECPFDDSPTPPLPTRGNIQSPAQYTIECEVREAESDVDESPPSGLPQSMEVESGGSHTFHFDFEEMLDDGLDGVLQDCSLANNTDFQIITSTVYPQDIPAGGPPLRVSVQGTDPGDPDTITDTLTCIYFDTQNPDGTTVSWPLELIFGGDFARFEVRKEFNDHNPAGVAVTISCDTGLPLEQTKIITDYSSTGDHVVFVVGDFDDGELDCDITEVVPRGYSENYEAGPGGSDSDNNVDACRYNAVEGDDEHLCVIDNDLDQVRINVTKRWIDDHPEFNNPTFAKANWECYNVQFDDYRDGFFGCDGDECGRLHFYGSVSSDSFTVLLKPATTAAGCMSRRATATPARSPTPVSTRASRR